MPLLITLNDRTFAPPDPWAGVRPMKGSAAGLLLAPEPATAPA